MSFYCEHCDNGECSIEDCTYLCRFFLIWERTYSNAYKDIVEEYSEVSVERW